MLLPLGLPGGGWEGRFPLRDFGESRRRRLWWGFAGAPVEGWYVPMEAAVCFLARPRCAPGVPGQGCGAPLGQKGVLGCGAGGAGEIKHNKVNPYIR